MKILYYHCHEVLTYNEVKLLRELGHEVQIAFQYADRLATYPTSSPLVSQLRPPVDFDPFEPEDADACIFTYFMHQLDHSLQKYASNKKKIWRFIGQSNPVKENKLSMYAKRHNLKLVRYSSLESLIPNFAGQDALIRFNIDESDYGEYTGDNPRIIISSNRMLYRKNVLSAEQLLSIVDSRPHLIFGIGNDFSDKCRQASYADYKNTLANSRLFLTAGTIPASYTLGFMEALAAGIPVVVYDNNHKLNEMRSIIINGINGFISSDIIELREICDELLSDIEYAKEIGKKGRETAIKIFGKEAIKEQWRQLLSK